MFAEHARKLYANIPFLILIFNLQKSLLILPSIGASSLLIKLFEILDIKKHERSTKYCKVVYIEQQYIFFSCNMVLKS
jgi:hypothetical protein